MSITNKEGRSLIEVQARILTLCTRICVTHSTTRSPNGLLLCTIVWNLTRYHSSYGTGQ